MKSLVFGVPVILLAGASRLRPATSSGEGSPSHSDSLGRIWNASCCSGDGVSKLLGENGQPVLRAVPPEDRRPLLSKSARLRVRSHGLVAEYSGYVGALRDEYKHWLPLPVAELPNMDGIPAHLFRIYLTENENVSFNAEFVNTFCRTVATQKNKLSDHLFEECSSNFDTWTSFGWIFDEEEHFYNVRKVEEFFEERRMTDSPIYHVYHALVPYAYQGDLFRLLLLYVFGGWYVDMKAGARINREDLEKRLRETLPSDNIAFVAACQDFSWLKEAGVISDHDLKWGLMNAFLAAKPGHPAVGDIIVFIVKNVLEHSPHKTPWSVTGPLAMAAAIERAVRFPISICSRLEEAKDVHGEFAGIAVLRYSDHLAREAYGSAYSSYGYASYGYAGYGYDGYVHNSAGYSGYDGDSFYSYASEGDAGYVGPHHAGDHTTISDDTDDAMATPTLRLRYGHVGDAHAPPATAVPGMGTPTLRLRPRFVDDGYGDAGDGDAAGAGHGGYRPDTENWYVGHLREILLEEDKVASKLHTGAGRGHICAHARGSMLNRADYMCLFRAGQVVDVDLVWRARLFAALPGIDSD